MMQLILTDIEGTTSSIDFVHRVLFPYAKQHLGNFLSRCHTRPEVREQLLREWKEPFDLETVARSLNQWIDEDRKHPVLKTLQGFIWQEGYQAGQIVSHVYPEVPDLLRAWKKTGLGLAVYSSGSVEAQKLLFAHSAYGDLSSLFSDFFDTGSGPKREADSYRNIAAAVKLPPAAILFLSDIEEELDAAAQAGMQTCQLLRDSGMKSGKHASARDFFGVDALISREAKV